MNPNNESTLQTVALGQLAFFGYRSFDRLEFGWMAASIVLAILLELISLFVLRIKDS
jgi:hypothetical protein